MARRFNTGWIGKVIPVPAGTVEMAQGVRFRRADGTHILFVRSPATGSGGLLSEVPPGTLNPARKALRRDRTRDPKLPSSLLTSC